MTDKNQRVSDFEIQIAHMTMAAVLEGKLADSPYKGFLPDGAKAVLTEICNYFYFSGRIHEHAELETHFFRRRVGMPSYMMPKEIWEKVEEWRDKE